MSLLTVHCQAGQEFAVLFHRDLRIFIIFFNSLDKEIKTIVIPPGRQHHAERAANTLDQNDLNKLKKSEENSVQIRARSAFHDRKNNHIIAEWE